MEGCDEDHVYSFQESCEGFRHGSVRQAVKKFMLAVKKFMWAVKKFMLPVKKLMLIVKKFMLPVKKFMLPVKKFMLIVKKFMLPVKKFMFMFSMICQTLLYATDHSDRPACRPTEMN